MQAYTKEQSREASSGSYNNKKKIPEKRERTQRKRIGEKKGESIGNISLYLSLPVIQSRKKLAKHEISHFHINHSH